MIRRSGRLAGRGQTNFEHNRSTQLVEPAQLPDDQGEPTLSVADLLRLHVRIQQSMSTGASAHVLAAQLCELARDHVPGALVSIMWLDADGRLHSLATPGASPEQAAALGQRLTLELESRASSFVAGTQTSSPLLAEHVWLDPRGADDHAIDATLGPHTCWFVPIQNGNRTRGVFSLTGSMMRPSAPAIAGLLQQTAVIAGTILRMLDVQEEQAKQHQRRRSQANGLRRLTGFHAMLSQVNQLAASRPDVNALFKGVCRIAVVQAGLRLAWIGTPDASGVFQPTAAAGATWFLDAFLDDTGSIGSEHHSLAATAWREARTTVHQRPDVDAVPTVRQQAARRFGPGADIALPLMVRGAPRAVLYVYTSKEGALSAELVDLLEELAIDVGRALEAIDQQRHLDRLGALHTALMTQGEMLLRASSDAEMLSETCARLIEGTLFHAAWIARPDAARRMRALASAGPGMALLAARRFTLDDTPPPLVVRSWRDERTVVSGDLLADPELAHYRPTIQAGSWRSAAMVPIRRGGAPFAILALGAPQPDVFDPEVVALCERIAALLGRGLDDFDLKKALDEERRRQFHLAQHDPLTGLANRRRFEEFIGAALADARREGARLCICMLDVDDFKPVNDRYGHPAGDSLLRQIGQRIHGALRRSDMVARLGGDEFALALDDLNTTGAWPGLLVRISKAMRAPFDLGGREELRIGLSCGIAVFPDDGQDADLLLRRADAALYAAKAAKTGQTCNWRRWSDEIALPTPPPGISDPYGPEAQRLLAETSGIWPAIAGEFVEEFYADMASQAPSAPILSTLSPAEFAHLKVRQVAHLISLMAATTSRDAAHQAARTVGEIHALTGVDAVAMVQALGLYQATLAKHLAMQSLRPSERQNLMAVALGRLQEDHTEQMAANASTVAAYFRSVRRSSPTAGVPWVDAAQVHLDELAGLPGILSVRLVRPDAAGILQTLISSSTAGLPFGGLNMPGANLPTIDRARQEGQGLLSEAWHGAGMASTASYQTDPRTAPWHDAARRFGVRSAIALAVSDLKGHPVAALILFGAFPNQFESMWIRHVCADLAQDLSLLWHRRQDMAGAPVVPARTAAAWRERLLADGLAMYYQPIVNLRTGTPWKVEALARLVLEDGQIIAPTEFLPVLGMRDIDELFRGGLSQALAQIVRWDAEGVSLDVSVNLAPSTLCQPGCPLWVRDALDRAGIAPTRLFLEITEDQYFDPRDHSCAPSLSALISLGVNLVMDDLGAGYGGLQRLRAVPFRVVKLDRGLIRNMSDNPARSLGFVGALVQLGRALGAEVVAEGLETDELVEALTMLGADSGQGSALGEPMPAALVPRWMQEFIWKTNKHPPETPLGSLAAEWRATNLAQSGPMSFPPIPQATTENSQDIPRDINRA